MLPRGNVFLSRLPLNSRLILFVSPRHVALTPTLIVNWDKGDKGDKGDSLRNLLSVGYLRIKYAPAWKCLLVTFAIEQSINPFCIPPACRPHPNTYRQLGQRGQRGQR